MSPLLDARCRVVLAQTMQIHGAAEAQGCSRDRASVVLPSFVEQQATEQPWPPTLTGITSSGSGFLGLPTGSIGFHRRCLMATFGGSTVKPIAKRALENPGLAD